MAKCYQSFINSCNSKGKPGEMAVEKWLKNRFMDVQNTSNNPDWYEKAVDYICWDILSDYVYLDVKNDTKIQQTGNFFVELYTDIDLGTKGWYPKMLSANLPKHYVFYRNANTGLTYILPVLSIKQYLAEHKCRIVTPPDYYNGKITKYSKGYLVSAKDFCREYNIKKFVC